VIRVDEEPTVTVIAELAEGLQRILVALALQAHRRGRSRIAIGGLTVAQVSVLMTLRDRGPIQMTKLAAAERVPKSSISVAILRLETLGLVKRWRDTVDARLVFVALTHKGLAVVQTSLATRQEDAVTQPSRLSQAELEMLIKALAPLGRLADNVDRRTPAAASESTPHPVEIHSPPAGRASEH
jgi:DNA-binding MarR family transcriptional regulator